MFDEERQKLREYKKVNIQKSHYVSRRQTKNERVDERIYEKIHERI